MFGHLQTGDGLFDRLEEEADPALKLGRGALEGGQYLLIAPRLATRIGKAPMDQLRPAGKFRTYLAHAIAEADHVVEALCRELAQVLRPSARKIDAACAHHPYRVGMQRLGMAARAGRAQRAAGGLLGEGLGHLRARAVAGAQEQHPRRGSTATPPGPRARR